MDNYQAALNYETLVMALGRADNFCSSVFDEISQHCEVNEALPFNVATYSEVSQVSDLILNECYLKCRKAFEALPSETQIIDCKSPYWPKAASGVKYLYLLGNAQLLLQQGISVVGTRTPSNRGSQLTQEVVQALGESGFCIVSGLAKGVDGIAHITALAKNFATIGVIGTSVCEAYPKEHAKLQSLVAQNGLVVSQFAPSRPVQRYFFMQRNQLMSEISLASFVVEDRDGGGAVQQAQYSQKQGKKVFVLKEVQENRTFLWPRKFESAVVVSAPEKAGKVVKKTLGEPRVQKGHSKQLDPQVQPELF